MNVTPSQDYIRLTDEGIVGEILLTPKEAFELIGQLKDALFDWHSITGKNIDEENPY
jgi:hypothetical protein